MRGAALHSALSCLTLRSEESSATGTLYMKLTIRKTTHAFALLPLFAAANAHAGLDMPDNYFFFGAHASQYFFDANNSIDGNTLNDTTLPGLQLGYRVNPSWSLQAWWERNNYRADNGSSDGDMSALLASARLHFNNTSLLGFEPYVGVAAGTLSINNKTDNDESLGGFEFGLQSRLRPHWLIDFGARPLRSFDNERWDTEAYVALNFMLTDDDGDSRNQAFDSNKLNDAKDPTTATVFGDTDGDGVADALDQCENTMVGSQVDETGCEPDTDGDGVDNSLDRCADTPANTNVDDKGCALN